MQRIINFIVGNRITFLFAALMLLALSLTVRSHSYHQSKFLNSSKWVAGTFYGLSSDVTAYFGLRQLNETLVEENRKLHGLLLNATTAPVAIDSSAMPFEVLAANIIKNSYASPRNYLTIDKGEKHGLKKDMGAITPEGILGIVENTSANFATIQSILNTKSSINAKIKNTDYFGSLTWDTKGYGTVQLTDIPRSASILVGDTIITGGMSSIFPEGIPIGIVKKYGLNSSKSFFDIQVGLFNNMANLKVAYILKNTLAEERLDLEQETVNAN